MDLVLRKADHVVRRPLFRSCADPSVRVAG